MNRKEFFELLLNECDIEDKKSVNEDTNLEDLEEWDSLSMITIMSIFKTRINRSLTIVDIRNCETFKDILDLAGDYYEE